MNLPEDRTTLDLILEQALNTPDRPALIRGGRTMSYRELAATASSLAAQLLTAGAKKGDPLPLLMCGGLEYAVSVLAAMMTGSVFVPMDLEWPWSRIEAMLDDLNPRIVLSTRANASLDRFSFPLLYVDLAQLKPSEFAHWRRVVQIDDLMYGFYTSGSTGTPKCAINRHRGLLNRFLYMNRRFAADGNEIVLQNSNHVFDSSLWQLLWPLTNGARVVLPEARNALDLESTVRLIERHGVTMTDFVPAVLNLLVERMIGNPEECSRLTSLRNVLVGGDELGGRYARRFLELLRQVKLTNTYGPTEASIGMVFHAVSVEDADPIPLGRPIDNTYVLVLSERLELVPVGCCGEIYIGGACLGCGYLNDLARTRESWIRNRFPEIPGAQLYRTGDLGRFEPNGLLYFMGRRDHQVKFAGIRVELGEIERQLLNCEGVREAVVTLRSRDAQNKKLVAYVVAGGGASEQMLRRRLEKALPRPLIPSKIVFLESMPLTRNGKVDRKHLTALADGTGVQADLTPQTGNSVKERLRRLWLEALESGHCDPNSDFFACGGDSLQAARLCVRIEEDFAVRLRASQLSEHFTFENLVRLICGRRDSHDGRLSREARRIALRDSRLSGSIETGKASEIRSSSVFLTGATGFLGVHLLAELLAQTDARVHCLVRGDASEGARKIKDKLASYTGWNDAWGARIVAVSGDLNSPRLGLSAQDWLRTAASGAPIVHCGAVVDLVRGYPHLRQTNVLGTHEVLRLASSCSAKPVHLISSLSVVAPPWDESFRPSNARFPATGYDQSKWAAERLAFAAAKRGLPLRVYRLGEVMPHSRTGIPNPNSIFSLLIKCCVDMRRFPDEGIFLDYSPVDHVARLLTYAIGERVSTSEALHIFHPRGASLREIFRSLVDAGIPLECVPAGEFCRALTHRCEVDADRSAIALMTVLSSAGLNPPGPTDEPVSEALRRLFQTPAIQYRQERTARSFPTEMWDWPEIDGPLLSPYAAFLKETI